MRQTTTGSGTADDRAFDLAWVPIPFARLEEITPGQGEQFLVTEEERINLASVHVQVMQLAEIFLAYNKQNEQRGQDRLSSDQCQQNTQAQHA